MLDTTARSIGSLLSDAAIAAVAIPDRGNEALRSQLVRAYFRGAVGFVFAHAQGSEAALRLCHETLVPATERCEAGSELWQPEVGAAIRASKGGDHVGAALRLLFALHDVGTPCEWEVDLARPLTVACGGNVFELRGRVHVRGVRSSIEIASSEVSGALQLHRAGARWMLNERLPLDPDWRFVAPHFVALHGQAQIYVRSWREPEFPNAQGDKIVYWPEDVCEPGSHEHCASACRNLASASALLGEFGPGYTQWVAGLFRGVAAAPLTHDDMRQSGSYTDHPGVFHCGFPGASLSIAEVMIHELSHQHYLLINSVFPLAQDSEGDLYFSSLKGSNRSITRVLFAFHAAANMSLFWRNASRATTLSDYYVREMADIDKHTCQLAATVAGARGLTAAGQALFDLQRGLLDERGLAMPC